MLFKIYRSLIFLVPGLLLFSCGEYQKTLKGVDTKAKYAYAEKLYEEGDFKRANKLLTQIAPKYVGKPQGERVTFFLANSYFMIEDYNFAGYQFERFLKSYPRSDKASEAGYLGAKSYYMLSPKYSLDQTDTDKALIKLQNFINAYPESKFMEEANAMAKELTVKKEKKEFEIAKQFTKLGGSYILDYNVAAIASLDNFVSDHPGSIFREEAYFLKLKATTNLALNSTDKKKKERLDDAKEAYDQLIKSYPETKFGKEAADIAQLLSKELDSFNQTETISK
ncbi:MAG: outer membrane protein assembly factor BamD [Flavobacteriaceae bacterium]